MEASNRISNLRIELFLLLRTKERLPRGESFIDASPTSEKIAGICLRAAEKKVSFSRGESGQAKLRVQMEETSAERQLAS